MEEIKIEIYENTDSKGNKRTLYKTKVGKTTYGTDSLEKLMEMVKNHVEETEGTFDN